MGGMLHAFAGQSVEHYSTAADAFLRAGRHPTLDRAFHECGYLPMIELLRYLEATRVHELHRLGRRPRLHATRHRRDLRHPLGTGDRELECAHLHRRTSTAAPCPKATGDSSMTGRSSRCGSGAASGQRPILAGGNSNGDIPMLHYAGGQDRPGLRLLVLHDDGSREFAYTTAPRPHSSRRTSTAGRSSASRMTGHRVRRLRGMTGPDVTGRDEGAGRRGVRVVSDVPRQMVRVVYRDPEHICERLTLQAVHRLAEPSSSGLKRLEPVARTATSARSSMASGRRPRGSPGFRGWSPGPRSTSRSCRGT